MDYPKAVVFDLFGTLTISVSQAHHDRQLADMAGALAVEPGAFAAAWRDALDEIVTGSFPDIRTTIESVAGRAGAAVDDTVLDRAVQVRIAATRYYLTHLRDDTISTLAQLKEMGLKRGLISDTTPEVGPIWQDTPLADMFDSVIFSDVVKLRKPDPAIYRKVCDGLGCTPHECIYVGDGGSNELTGAQHVGMLPVLVGPTMDHELFQPSRDAWMKDSIASLSGVLSYVQGGKHRPTGRQ